MVTEEKMEKRYFTLDEVSSRLQVSSADLIHFSAHGDFPVFVLAFDWPVVPFVKDADTDQWQAASLAPHEISGPYCMYPEDLLRLEARPSLKLTRLKGDESHPKFHLHGDSPPDHEWELRIVGEGISLSECKLVVRGIDVAELVQSGYKSPTDTSPSVGEYTEGAIHPITKRSLLTIIAALAQEANYDLSHHSSCAGKLIEKTELVGNPLSKKTLEKYFQEAFLQAKDLSS